MINKIKRFNHLIKRVSDGAIYVDKPEATKEGIEAFEKYLKELSILTQEIYEMLGRRITKEEFTNGIEI